MKRTILLLALMLTAIGVGAPSAAASNEPLRLTFDKVAVGPGVWEGTVSGDVSGGLRTELLGLGVSGPVWHVTFDWTISAGEQSLTARLSGTLNTDTGAVVMNGTVIDGFLRGAQVHEEGQLVDASTLTFHGSIQIMPASA